MNDLYCCGSKSYEHILGTFEKKDQIGKLIEDSSLFDFFHYLNTFLQVSAERLQNDFVNNGFDNGMVQPVIDKLIDVENFVCRLELELIKNNLL